MGSRRELKGAAYGVGESFISRYNDVGGYWGIGKLCRHAGEIEIDLLTRKMQPPGAQFEGMVNQFSDALEHQLEIRKVPRELVAAARIRVRFNVKAPEKAYRPWEASGLPFECIVELTDDRGKSHRAQITGWCNPHDPAKESCNAK